MTFNGEPKYKIFEVNDLFFYVLVLEPQTYKYYGRNIKRFELLRGEWGRD